MLGIQWPSTLGPVLWDFQKLYMAFNYQGQKIALRSTNPKVIKAMEANSLSQVLQQGAQMCFIQLVNDDLQLLNLLNCNLEPTSEIPVSVNQILHEFDNVFQKP